MQMRRHQLWKLVSPVVLLVGTLLGAQTPMPTVSIPEVFDSSVMSTYTVTALDRWYVQQAMRDLALRPLAHKADGTRYMVAVDSVAGVVTGRVAAWLPGVSGSVDTGLQYLGARRISRTTL